MTILLNGKKFLIFVILLIFILYFKITFFEFLNWDDDKQILLNDKIKIINFENLIYNFFNERFTFIPLFLYSVFYNLFKDNPVPYHFFSIILHIINIVIFYFLIKRIFRNNDLIIFSTLLFALHPLRIESVAWISEWKDLLFTMFGLLALYYYIDFIKTKKTKFLLLYIFLCLLSGYSKIQGLLIPFSSIILEYFLVNAFIFENILINILVFIFVLVFFKKKFAVLFFLLILIFFLLFKKKSEIKIINIHLSSKKLTIILSIILFLFIIFLFSIKKLWFWENNFLSNIDKRIYYFFFSLAYYFKQFLLPIKQLPVYSYPQSFNLFLKETIISTILVLTIFLLFIHFYLKIIKEKKLLVFGLAFFIINISIVLHIIPIEGRLLVGERYTYFAYTGLIFIASSIYSLMSNKIKNFCFIIITILFSLIIFFRLDIWKNSETLFSYVIKNKPNTQFAYNNLGSYYLSVKDYDKAKKMFLKAIKIDSTNSISYFNLAMAYAGEQDFNKTLELLKIALKKRSKDYEKSLYYLTLSQTFEKINNAELTHIYNDSAIYVYSSNIKALYRKAYFNFINKNYAQSKIYLNKILKTDKYNADALNLLGFIELKRKNYYNALKLYNQLLKYHNDYFLGFHNRGYTYFLMNNYEKAIEDFTKAITLNTNFIESYKFRATIFFEQHQWTKAIHDYNIFLSKNDTDFESLHKRALCYARIGNVNNAINDFKRAFKLNSDNKIITEILQLYIKQKQYDSAYKYLFLLEKDTSFTGFFYYSRGIIYFFKNNIDLAINDFNISLLYNKSKGELLFWLGECYRLKNNLSKACNYYNQSLNSGFIPVKRKIEKYCKF